MSLIEKIEQFRQIPEKPVVLKKMVEDVIRKTNIDNILIELNKSANSLKIDHSIQENGDKALKVVTWPNTYNEHINQIIISIRKNNIKLIGGMNQFINIESNDFKNRDFIEECVAKTFNNPLKIEKPL